MITREFVLAGRAIFTVANGKGERYTFKVIPGRFPPNRYAMLLTGPDNSSDYFGICNMKSNGNCYAGMPNSKPVKVFQWAVRQIWNQSQLPPGYTIQHAGRCGRCGRLLTTPESIESGFGPDCITKIEGLRHVQRTEANAAHGELG